MNNDERAQQVYQALEKIKQLKQAQEIISDNIEAEREVVDKYLEETHQASLDLDIAKVSYTKAGTTRKMNYEALLGYSPKLYKRFVTEKPKNGNMVIKFKK